MPQDVHIQNIEKVWNSVANITYLFKHDQHSHRTIDNTEGDVDKGDINKGEKEKEEAEELFFSNAFSDMWQDILFKDIEYKASFWLHNLHTHCYAEHLDRWIHVSLNTLDT